jgi:ethanolamine utilization protein EutA (predicted chaperonin)
MVALAISVTVKDKVVASTSKSVSSIIALKVPNSHCVWSDRYLCVRNIDFTSIPGLKNGIAGVKEPADFNNIVYIFFRYACQ